MRARVWGIEETYLDFRGEQHRVPPATIRSLLEAMGAVGSQPPPNPVRVVQEGEDVVLDGHFELLTEDGGSERIGNRLPSDLGPGYHNLVDLERDETKRLIVAPARCFLPTRLTTWGWMIQLYALRAQASWGIGDLGVLRRFNEWAAATGAGMTMINPLHSVEPQLDEASPYFPGSRLWRNSMYIDVEDVPGAISAADELEGLGVRGRALNDERVIRRDAVCKLKLAALDLLWDRWPGDPAFDEFCRRGGDVLEKFATFAALAEAHGDDWRRWPAPLRRPENGAVVREARARRRRVDFNKWLQWLLDRQLAHASKSVALVGDLAIGVNPRGFDAWLWQDVFATHVSVGAPPDDFNLEGQDWSLAAFDPWRLRAAGYEPFIAMLRSAFRHMRGLRYDHVMGLWRLFWIPDGAMTPAAGAYVRYPAGDLLAILALESARAGAFVVGEDLGTVEEGVREEMARRDLLSYRLLCFEPSDPSAYPAKALAAVTNHDLPTLPGLWRRGSGETGAGPSPNEAFEEVVRERVRRITGLDATADVADAVAATYRALAGAPSRLVAATLEDALGVSEQPNRPGSTGGAPNWSLALPASLEQIGEDPGPRRLARILRRRKG